VPAPAVIPALIAYVKVVAVKTLVVGARLAECRDGPRVCPGNGAELGTATRDVGRMRLSAASPQGGSQG